MTNKMAAPGDLPSKSQIEKAGKYLRNLERGDHAGQPFDFERWARARDVVTRFREAHAYPMGKIRMGLASMTNTEGIDSTPTQRHKRVPRIVRKLVRMQDTNLARLEDIGGCRVVVADASEMDRLCRRIRKNWSAEFTRPPRDYIETPKPMGYRARHFIVRRDGRAIEVQVRTIGQQRWAETVEYIDARFGCNLKDEIGPDSLIENFQIAGEVIYRSEFGLHLPRELTERLQASNDRAIAEGYYKH